MIRLFLRAKHWQLFIFMFALPAVTYFTVMVNLVESMYAILETAGNDDALQASITDSFKWLPVVVFPSLLTFTGWLYSISVGLHNKLPNGHGLNLTLFRSIVFIPVILIGIILFVTYDTFVALTQITTDQEAFAILKNTWFLFPLSLLSVVGSFYSYYFTAKTINLVEKGNTQFKPDFAGDFILIWFYFIGVWSIQPKINKLQQADYTAPDDGGETQSARIYDN